METYVKILSISNPLIYIYIIKFIAPEKVDFELLKLRFLYTFLWDAYLV